MAKRILKKYRLTKNYYEEGNASMKQQNVYDDNGPAIVLGTKILKNGYAKIEEIPRDGNFNWNVHFSHLEEIKARPTIVIHL